MSRFHARAQAALFASLVFLASCNGKTEAVYPKRDEDVRRERGGSLTDGKGLLSFGTGGEKESAGTGIGVNGYLWRASLDTISFMPIASADPFGGVILTDWYENPQVAGERTKLTVTILDKTLRADGVKVAVFKQKLEKGQWRDTAVDPDVARRIEDTILTRARERRVSEIAK